jgi:8-oxo-dGTP pyrophosphatase MutT (NUDIX family)
MDAHRLLSADHVRARLGSNAPRELARGAGVRFAAVAAVLRWRPGGPEILLIRRREDPRDPWSGHMALPGGREEPGDTDLCATAVRETREEVALDLAAGGRLLGRLDEMSAVARGRPVDLVVAPFVFELCADVEPAPCEEVEAVLWAPLAAMLDGSTATTRSYVLDDQLLELPAYRVGEHVVWGLTYRMLGSLFDVLR